MENFDLKGYLKENKLNEEAFQYDPSIDYLAEYELLPTKIQEILFKYGEDGELDLEAKKALVDELEANGWTVEYDFTPDGIFGLRPKGEDRVWYDED